MYPIIPTSQPCVPIADSFINGSICVYLTHFLNYHFLNVFYPTQQILVFTSCGWKLKKGYIKS